MSPAGEGRHPDLQAIRKIAEGAFDAYLADLRTLVNIDCGTFVPAGVNQVADLMATPSIVDARNLLDRNEVRRLGFQYVGIGR